MVVCHVRFPVLCADIMAERYHRPAQVSVCKMELRGSSPFKSHICSWLASVFDFSISWIKMLVSL